jgi:prephenate dehydrogenase
MMAKAKVKQPGKKKMISSSANYLKGTCISNKQELIDVIQNSKEHIELLNQTIYDDDSQSMTIKIHFIP